MKRRPCAAGRNAVQHVGPFSGHTEVVTEPISQLTASTRNFHAQAQIGRFRLSFRYTV